ncbi:MAG: DNA replication/repair protein RecF [Acidimicrobiia bacterium]|nr:DNA replication/repair protein RecF [Acidimicrobiia bacterium]
MILNCLTVSGFRNLAEQSLPFSPQLNIIAGSNGQGKTNLLEAIHVLALSRSFRTHQSRDLIRHGAVRFRVSGTLLVKNDECQLAVEQGKDGKSLLVNGSKRDVFDYLGRLHMATFASLQIEQFKAEPEYRRRLVDRGLYHLQPSHLRRMALYSRIVKQKNSLLREAASVYTKATAELLDVWDQQIAEAGAKIIQARQLYVERVREKLKVQTNGFTPEALDIKYLAANEISSTASLEDIQSQLSNRLTNHREREIRLRRSLVGPHRDEILAEVDGNAIQRFASAGQQRSALLAFNLAQMEVYFDAYGEYPVFLIDDVDSELDAQRMNQLLRVLESKTQIFVTTSKPKLIQAGSEPLLRQFTVVSGRVQRIEV